MKPIIITVIVLTGTRIANTGERAIFACCRYRCGPSSRAAEQSGMFENASGSLFSSSHFCLHLLVVGVVVVLFARTHAHTREIVHLVVVVVRGARRECRERIRGRERLPVGGRAPPGRRRNNSVRGRSAVLFFELPALGWLMNMRRKLPIIAVASSSSTRGEFFLTRTRRLLDRSSLLTERAADFRSEPPSRRRKHYATMAALSVNKHHCCGHWQLAARCSAGQWPRGAN